MFFSTHGLIASLTAALTFMMLLPTIALVHIEREQVSILFLPPRLIPSTWSTGLAFIGRRLWILGLLSAPFIAVWFVVTWSIFTQISSVCSSTKRITGAQNVGDSRKHIFQNLHVPPPASWNCATTKLSLVVRRWSNKFLAFPGMLGKMLIDSIKASNNTMVIGTISSSHHLVFLLLQMLGDILMTVLLIHGLNTNTKGGKQ